MDTQSGRIFPPEVMARLHDRDAEADEVLEAARAAFAAERLVEVSEDVVQKVRLGERELERRARRRR